MIDASVIAKLHVAEPLADLARDLFATGEDHVTLSHALAEVADVLVRKVGLGQFTRAQLEAATRDLPHVIRQIPISELLPRATTLALDLSLSVYDSLYLALAEREGTVVVTWDQRLLRRVAASPYAGLATPLDPGWTSS